MLNVVAAGCIDSDPEDSSSGAGSGETSEGTATEGADGSASSTSNSTSGSTTADGSSTTTDSGNTTTGEDTTDSDSGALEECACPPDGCGEMLCPIIFVDLDDDVWGTGGEETFDDAPLNCALEALRDGFTGQIEWRYSENGGQFTDHGSLWLRGDGTAVYSSIEYNDICFDEVGEIATGTLKVAEVFSDCLAVESAWERFECVRNALATKTTVCQERVENCDGV
jgi:hypothetical protein